MSQDNTNNKYLNRSERLKEHKAIKELLDSFGFPEKWNIIPISRNSKVASGSWEKYQKVKYQRTKLHKDNGNYVVICGKISKDLLILDLDLKDKKHFKPIYSKFKTHLPKLSRTLIVETPHGFHLYYYMNGFSETSHNRKNACYNSKLAFTGKTKTKFERYLNGFDCKCEGDICNECYYIPNTKIECISDIAVLDKFGKPIQVIEIVNKKELYERRIALYLNRNIQVIIIKTEDILKLTHLYTNLKVHQIIEES